LILVGNSTYGGFTFTAAVDGSYVPALPGQLLLDGKFVKSVKIMAGHNSNEGLLFTSPFVQTEAAYVAFLESYFPNLTASLLNNITEVLYPPLYNGSYPYKSQLERTALTYAEFNINCNRVFMNAALPSISYGYLFSVSPGLHAVDIEYTFYNGNITTSLYGPPINGTLAHAFQQYIVNFTKGGSPNGRQTTDPIFPVYGTGKVVMDVDNVDFGFHLKDTDATVRCAFWQAAPYF
jgi:cholinesterase